MKNWILALSLLISLSASGETLQEKNKKLVIEFYELAFNKHKPTEAAKKYFGPKYIQHNPHVPNGAAPFYEYFEDYFKKNSEAHVLIKRALADGDLVALHLHSRSSKKDLGQAVVDIFRLENGKIVEHFDVVQPVPEKTENGNTMFEGTNEK